MFVDTWQDDDEFVAADSGDHIGGSDIGARLGDESSQYLIADVVSVLIVDLFEVIQVDYHQCKQHRGPLEIAQLFGDDPTEPDAVERTGEGIRFDLSL